MSFLVAFPSMTAAGINAVLAVKSSPPLNDFSFTSALCQAAANALMEGTAVSNLAFVDCSFCWRMRYD
jgi:hypothetical protein